MTENVGFGIIGAGAISAFHASSMAALDNVRLIGFYDPVKAAAEKRAAEFNCKAYSDFEEFLADPEIQAVTIGIPTGLHGKIAIQAARAGKHILCEKPLEITPGLCDEVIKACDENNVLLATVFQSRFTESVKKVKAAADAGRFGKMILSSAQVRWYRDTDYYAKSPWRGTWKMDGGGALMNQSIHTVDLLLYLNGDPAEVSAFAGTLTHDIEVEDTLCAAVRYKNGSMGTIEVSTSCAPGFPRRLEFSGSKGSVTIEEDQIVRWSFTESLPGDESVAIRFDGNAGGGSNPTNIKSDSHAAQIQDLANAILNGGKPMLDGVEGRRAVAFINGIYESARTGKKIVF
ncbi:MAG: Gfo/Idh/MocA family oxidoreductase [Lentisphaeria bacterium]|nr:Gfo/Idh/MocA family oxidoreductase [Lentisphaeria bacterium]